LEGTEISGDLIPRVIDELPIVALAGCFAKGVTVIRDAQELRVKESDRIKATVEGLSTLGADIRELPDGMIIQGTSSLDGGVCRSYGDHRIAMTMAIGGLLARGNTVIDGAEAVAVSYTNFWDELKRMSN
jgi:3-phosphoshikimate 1-carboxyvinyltransferase